jgi:hypothetical protein
VVGTVVLGRQLSGVDIRWNAMYWGFGLEGVGESGENTVGRTRLLGDTFNYLARNLYPQAIRSQPGGTSGTVSLSFEVPMTAEVPTIRRATVSWGVGAPEVIELPEPVAVTQLRLQHTYETLGDYFVRVELAPVLDSRVDSPTAAPLHYQGMVTAERSGSLYLPATANKFAVRAAPEGEAPR